MSSAARHLPQRERLALGGFVLLLIVAAGLLSPSFLSAGNFRDMLVQAAPLGFIVIGQTLVILVRGLDLSVASITATVAVMATAFDSTSNSIIPLIFGCGILLGALAGLANGYLVARRGISPFLATLAVMIVLQGLRFAYTKGAPSGAMPDGFAFLAGGSVMGLPVSIWLLTLIAIVVAVLLSRTVFGRELYLTGSNPQAAWLIGIPVEARVMAVYVLSGVLAAIAGLFLVGYVGIVDNWTGRGLELDSIAAAIMGGASLRGGKATVLGALLGAAVLILIFNIMLMLGLSIEFQLIVKGLIIIAAAAIYSLGNRT